jgi:hypothetical protein
MAPGLNRHAKARILLMSREHGKLQAGQTEGRAEGQTETRNPIFSGHDEGNNLRSFNHINR